MTTKTRIPVTAFFAAVAACAPSTFSEEGHSTASVAVAADATGIGPLETTSSEYRLSAAVDPDVLGDRATEIWARVYRPRKLPEGAKSPLLVFLHGNHATCGRGSNPRIDDSVQYTMEGSCPPGDIVVPNHLGYGYAADRLASWGYVVVSINANRGITGGANVEGDFGLNLARGRLVLKHLQLLSAWNAEPGATPASLGVDLAAKLDFENVGLMGHSRGGEGVRAAYALYRDEGSPWPARMRSRVVVKGIFEIAPVDGQTNRVLDAFDAAWNVLLPMCDGDVLDLQGMKPFDRMLAAMNESNPTPKGMYAVWGANHNFFNTEWQQADPRRCRGWNNSPLFVAGQPGSERQKTAGLYGLTSFFRAHVGANAEPAFQELFDPRFEIPAPLASITRIGRAYADAASTPPVLTVEDFTMPSGTSLGGQRIEARSVDLAHGGAPEHDPSLRVASVRWTTASADTTLTVPWSASRDGVDATTMTTIDFRTGLQNATVATPTGRTNFTLQLVNADDTLSRPVQLQDYFEYTTGGHVILETIRVPLADFGGANLSALRGLRFTFDDTSNGEIFISSIQFSRATKRARSVELGQLAEASSPSLDGAATTTITTGNRVTSIRSGRQRGSVEVELESEVRFPVMDDLVRLRVGDTDVLLSRFGSDGDTRRIVFALSSGEYARVPDGAELSVLYGSDTQASRVWRFGKLDKSAIER